jgi:phospholipid/cholesterol/gamma-HCH transport system substrate-binding protein
MSRDEGHGRGVAAALLGNTRLGLAIRGIVAILVAAVAYTFCFAWGSQVFVSRPHVTATVPASAGALLVSSSVQYHGVNVGQVDAIDAGTQNSVVTLGISAANVDRLPANVQVRLVPRTIFGNFYVDLVNPAAAPTGRSVPSLQPGDTLLPDQSKATVQLYQTFSRIYDLVAAINPADLNAALTAVADALRGKGAALGQAIDTLHRSMVNSQPVLDRLGRDLNDVATLSGELNTVAPDLLAALGNSITISSTIIDKRQGLTDLLSAGARASGDAATLIGDNKDRIITLVADTDPLLTSLNSKPNQLTTIYQGLQALVTKLPLALANGPWLSVDLKLTTTGLQPYGQAQCPRYGARAAPNCAQQASNSSAPQVAGTAGPVGGPQEKAQLSQLFGNNADLDSMLAGPILRGTTVIS